MGSSGQQQAPTQTTQQILSPEQRELMQLAMPGIREFAASTPQRYQSSGIAAFDPLQTQGQESVLASAGTTGDLARSAAGANQFYTGGDIWNPSSNQNLQGAIDASVRPIYDNLTERALPAIRSEATSTGNFGSSRQGIAEGIATREASRAAGDTASKLAQGQYETNVNAQLKAMGLLPTVQQGQTAEGTTISGVGDVRQAREQALLGETIGNFNYDELAPFLQSKEIMSLLAGLPGGSTVSTGSVPQANKMGQALGGAATGASLGTAIMPGFGTGIGAAGGALLPFLF